MAIVSYKTPGVYVKEIDAFPPSIVGVQTAVPVFIGFTEKAAKGATPVAGRPVAINSMVDFVAVFGGDLRRTFALTKAPAAKEKADDETPAAAARGDAPAQTQVAEPALDVLLGVDAYRLDHVGASKFYLYDSMRLFYANGGGPCYVVSAGSYTDEDGITSDALIAGLAAVKDLVGPTMLVIPDATLLPTKAAFDTVVLEMIRQCGDEQDRVAILDVWGAATAASPDDVNTAIDGFRAGVAPVRPDYLRYGMAYFPFLNTTVVDEREMSYANFDLGTDGLATLRTALTAEADRLYPPVPTKADPTKTEANPRAIAVKAYIGKIVAPAAGAGPDATLNQALTANLPVLNDLFAHMAARQGVLPPSAAMAGVYTTNDVQRGVWNAPANVSLASVSSPTVKISNLRQEDLNIPINGLAINAIREFVGRGSVVWGARTLDGNSNDWRYIQIRRALIYIEESTKLALNKFVFAPNVGQTWVTVTAMINAFLQQMWSQGGLMGATPSEAFQVQCGEGSTMTAQDILEGRMVVQISLQLVRPAEFIILTFKQEMRGGGA